MTEPVCYTKPMTKLPQAPQLPEVCQRFGVRRLALFGSALRPDFRADSDLDFLVEFGPMPPEERAKAYFGLLEELEQLFGRPIDLVEAGAVRNPYVRRTIEQNQQTVYATA